MPPPATPLSPTLGDKSEFRSAWQKFARGFHHAVLLRNYVLTFSDEPQGNAFLTFEHVHDPTRNAISVRVASLGELPSYWSTTLGDVLFNYRSALDHIAWAIVGRGGRNPEAMDEQVQRAIYFPIARSEENFRKQIRQKLPGATPDDIDIVRSRQPYLDRKFNPDHWLVRLSELNNLDKHREIRPMYLYPAGADIKVNDPYHCRVLGAQAEPGAVRIAVGAEIAHVPVEVTGPHPRISLDPHFTLEVGVDDSATLGKLLDICSGQIKALLLEFSAMPPLDDAFAPIRRDRPEEADEDPSQAD